MHRAGSYTCNSENSARVGWSFVAFCARWRKRLLELLRGLGLLGGIARFQVRAAAFVLRVVLVCVRIQLGFLKGHKNTSNNTQSFHVNEEVNHTEIIPFF